MTTDTVIRTTIRDEDGWFVGRNWHRSGTLVATLRRQDDGSYVARVNGAVLAYGTLACLEALIEAEVQP